MFELTPLSKTQVQFCEHTISPNTFYMIVGNALIKRQDLSVVRMGDGEVRLWMDVHMGGDDPVVPTARHDRRWLATLGVLGIPKRILKIGRAHV